MKRVLILMGMLLLAYSGTAQAVPISLGSATQNGDVFSLSYTTTADLVSLGGDLDGDAFLFTLTVDTTNHTLPSGDYFNSVAISPGGPYDGASLTDWPGKTGSTSVWTYMAGGTSNSGTSCDGKGNAFVCAQYTSGTKANDNKSTYTWTWFIDNPTIDPTQAHVKAIWVNSDGVFVDQISKDTTGGGSGSNGQTPVPEPASLALFGTGLALAANKLRKKRA